MTIEGLTDQVRALNAEWSALARQRPPEVARWRQGCAPLAAAEALGDVLESVRHHADEVLGRLLAECLAGDVLAGRVVVQAMLPKMILLARSDREHELGAYLAALWERLRSYPLPRRPRRIAANLALDSLKAVKRSTRVTPGAVVSLTDWAQPAAEHRAAAAAAVNRGGAARVLGRAVSLGVIDDEAREALSVVYLDGLSSTQAGQVLGVTPEAVRARCSRAVRRLRVRAGELIDAAG